MVKRVGVRLGNEKRGSWVDWGIIRAKKRDMNGIIIGDFSSGKIWRRDGSLKVWKSGKVIMMHESDMAIGL